MTNEQLEKLVIGNRNKQLTYGKDNNLGAAYFMLKNYLETQTVFDAKGWFDCFWGRIAEIVNQRKLDSTVSGWISVNEVETIKDGEYLVHVSNGYISIDEYNNRYDGNKWSYYNGHDGNHVTHFIPIPPLPN